MCVNLFNWDEFERVCLPIKDMLLVHNRIRESSYKLPRQFFYVLRLKKTNKCFSGHFFEKQMRQGGFYFLFPQKHMRPLFYILIHRKLFFLFILSIKILIFWILTYDYIINEAQATLFFHSSLKKKER